MLFSCHDIAKEEILFMLVGSKDDMLTKNKIMKEYKKHKLEFMKYYQI